MFSRLFNIIDPEPSLRAKSAPRVRHVLFNQLLLSRHFTSPPFREFSGDKRLSWTRSSGFTGIAKEVSLKKKPNNYITRWIFQFSIGHLQHRSPTEGAISTRPPRCPYFTPATRPSISQPHISRAFCQARDVTGNCLPVVSPSGKAKQGLRKRRRHLRLETIKFLRQQKCEVDIWRKIAFFFMSFGFG